MPAAVLLPHSCTREVKQTTFSRLTFVNYTLRQRRPENKIMWNITVSVPVIISAVISVFPSFIPSWLIASFPVTWFYATVKSKSN